MFAMAHRHSSSRGLQLWNLLFLLHIGMTLLTIIHASNRDFPDNEAIIQLSMDSIHVVRSFDPRVAHIEENVSDQEEKEILVALLTSFDDPTDEDRTDELKKQNNIKIPLKSGTPSASFIRFRPSSLHFAEQSISMAKMHSMTIINDDDEPLELYSLSGTSVQFYSTFFEQTVLSPHGGNTSIHVYYLPRSVGPTKSTFTIKTNRGHFYYQVDGIGTFNPFRVYPFVNVVVPLNSSYEHVIHFHNPYNHSLDVNEIYTSDENLIIELLEYKNPKNKISKAFEHNEQWHLKPYETKAIIKMNYIAYKLGLLHGFICIKTNANDTLIIPVEINVSNRSGLYSSVDLLAFNADRLIRSVSVPITIPVYAINNGPNSVTIADVQISAKAKDYVTVQTKRLSVPVNLHRYNQIADLTIHPQRIPGDVDEIHAFIHFFTSSNRNESALQIPFYSRVLHGSLDYVRTETMFDMSLWKKQRSTAEISKCHSVHVVNRFSTNIAVLNISSSHSGKLDDYVQVTMPVSFEYLRPNQLTSLFCLTLRHPSLASRSFSNIQTILNIETNISVFHLPIHLYNGFLRIGLPMDHSNGGIRRHDSNSLTLLLASIPIGTSRTVKFYLVNSNPIDIPLKRFELTIRRAEIQLESIEPLNETQSISRAHLLYRNENISQFVIPAQHQVTFSLRIRGKGPPRFANESLLFQTSYQTLRVFLQYDIVNGSLELLNKTPVHIDASPNRVGSVDISVQNQFDRSTTIGRITFLSHGACFAFHGSGNSTTVESNRTQKIGMLTFNLMTFCNQTLFTPESKYICGFDHHPEFKEQWNECLTALNDNELDQSVVLKFRYFWKEWTTFVRQQKIHTNIWLHTEQANFSYPVTVGFVWPSVLEQMFTTPSRAPIILDFQVTFINVSKSQNVLINNPSSQPVSYTIQLLETSPKGDNNTESVFSISTSSKQVRVVDVGVYQFELQPDEQMTVTVSYRPTLVIKHETYLIVRNNLTVLESIWLRGEGGAGSLNVGNRQSGSSTIPLIFEMTDKHTHLCSNSNGNPRLQKIVTLTNMGNLKTTIHEISFGNQKCSGKGFVVETCNDIEIGPNEKYYLKILFQPDYTLSEMSEVLTLNTNIGLMTYPILVRIAPNVLSFCYKLIPRPIWELRSYYLCLCSLSIFIVLVFTAAVFDARSLFDNYLARAEYRDRIQTNENKIFDLSDLSMAVQEEQKARERIESDKSTRSNSTRKPKSIDLSNQEPKPKANNATPRRSLSSIDKNSVTPLKSAASSETLETSGVSTSTGPKPGRTKSSKQSEETLSKGQLLGRQKSANISRDTSTVLRPPTPSAALSSSAVSDEDNEPFVVARPRRASTKGKELSTNSATKTTPTTLGVISTSTPTGNVTRKSSTDVEPSEQRSYPKNGPIEEKSPDDQPWQTVLSTRERYRATATRHEANNESVKPPSIQRNTNLMPPTLEKSKQSQARRRPHSKRQKPAIPTTVGRTKRQSLQHDAPIHQELLFAQLTEQLRAAGLPNAATACSMSIRSRCSSAPASEFGGDDDDEPTRNRVGTNPADHPDDDEDDEEEEEMIDWDEPDVPDDDFGLYASQTEHFLDRLTTMKPAQDKHATSSIPPLMSIPVVLPKPNGYTPLTATLSAPTRKENVEPSMHSQHMPGPIQRPNKLPWPSASQQPAFLSDSIQSPSTPDVLVQINHILHHQNSIQTVPSTPNVVNQDSASSTINEIATPIVPWTPFSPNGWPSKYEPSWPIGSIPTSDVPLRAASPQNPFVQRQMSKEESTVWPSALGTATPRPVSANMRTQGAALWNDLFSAAAPSSGDTPKTAPNSSMKFWPAPDSSPAESSSSNRPETESNNPFWNPMNLNGTAPAPPSSWWPKTPSDENNNDNDQSRWDFAR